MPSDVRVVPESRAVLWAGRIISALLVLFLLFDSVIHLMRIPPVVKGFDELGVPLSLAVPLGILEIACLAAYVVPRTAALGAVLLTGYLGGAVAIQLRVGNPLFAEALFPVYVAALLWVGLLLRDEKLRELLVRG